MPWEFTQLPRRNKASLMAMIDVRVEDEKRRNKNVGKGEV